MKKSNVSKKARCVRIAVDIGGTFTDGLAVLSPGGRIWVGKTLTTPHDPGEAVTTVMTDLLRQMASALESKGPAVTEVVHGTTLVTNTLIERKGARTGLIVTRGTRDVLTIAREIRYDLYDLNLEIPQPLVAEDKRLEADERLDVDGAALARVRQGQAYADARARCLTCGTSDRCLRWLDSRPARIEPPAFCPNLRLFEEYRKT